MLRSFQSPRKLRSGFFEPFLFLRKSTKSKTSFCLSAGKSRSFSSTRSSIVITPPLGRPWVNYTPQRRLAGARFCDFWRVVFVEEEHVEDDQGGADCDRGIGDVEGRPVVAAEPDFEEIRDGAMDDTIGYVAGGAAEQKREARSGQGAAAMTCDKEPSERADHYGRADDQHNAHGGGRRIGEDAEGDTRIATVHQINKIVD